MKFIFLLLLSYGLLFAEKDIDIENIESDKSQISMQEWLDDKFTLKPYRVNYLLPYGYRDDAYSANIPNTVEYSNIEAEIQVSLKLKVAQDLLGFNERYYVSYTHQAFWQIYIESAPFRENLYNPEGFVVFPVNDNDSSFNLRSVKFAIAHRSNGQPDTSNVTFIANEMVGNLSRSVNYVYSTFRFQHETLISDLKLWIPFPEDEETSDNPDLMDYTGYTSLKFTYFLDEHMFTLMGRGNPSTLKGAMEATYSYPLIHNNLFIKVFSGYGESLIDYNNHITKFSIGFSFSR